MRRWFVLPLLLVTLAMIFISSNPVMGKNVQAVAEIYNSDMSIVKNKPYEQIVTGSHALMNNVWGAPKDEVLGAGIFQNSDGTFGWYWDRSSPQKKSGEKCVLPIYPSIRIGGNRWERTRQTPFPLKLDEVRSFTLDIDYHYSAVPTGSYDLAYDIFLSEAGQSDSAPPIKAEVMVWLDGSQKQSKLHYKGDFSDGGNIFELYSWIMADGRTYYSFILKDNSSHQGHYSIDAGRLLEQLGLEPDLVIHGVEFGNEVWNGSGRIEIQQFNVNINGKEV